MEDKTTTAPDAQTGDSINGIAVDSSGRALAIDESQPETTSDQAAETSPEAPKEQAAGEVDNIDEPQGESSIEVDEDLSKWASNKGVSITSESERKLAEMARNSEKEFHAKRGEASTLQKSVAAQATEEGATELDGIKSELAQLKLERDVDRFYQDNPGAKALDSEMSQIVEERPHLAYDLEALYAVAKMKNAGSDTSAAKQAGGREALETLANKQRATAVQGSATTSQQSATRITPQNVDSLVGANSLDWYKEHLDEINAAMEL